jgi:AcrR family transcriptional regulator
LELLIEQGVDGASIEQIAARAKVARTTLYRRWSSKEALIAQAIAVARGAPEQLAAVDGVELTRLPRLLVDALAESLSTPGYKELAARLIGSVPNSPELMAVYWNSYMAPRREIIGNVLQKARAEGLIRKDSDPEILLDLVGGAIIYHLLVRPGVRTAREMRAYLLKVLRELGLSAARRLRPIRSGRSITGRARHESPGG